VAHREWRVRDTSLPFLAAKGPMILAYFGGICNGQNSGVQV